MRSRHLCLVVAPDTVLINTEITSQDQFTCSVSGLLNTGRLSQRRVSHLQSKIQNTRLNYTPELVGVLNVPRDFVLLATTFH